MWIQELRALRRSAFIGGDEVSKLIDGQIRIVGVKGSEGMAFQHIQASIFLLQTETLQSLHERVLDAGFGRTDPRKLHASVETPLCLEAHVNTASTAGSLWIIVLVLGTHTLTDDYLWKF